MSISSNSELSKDWFGLLSHVNHIIIDLNSMPHLLEEESESESFKKMISILTDRDFKVSLILDDSEYFLQWSHDKQVAVIHGTSNVEEITLNKNLFSASHFWISENDELQQYLVTQKSSFAYQQSEGPDEGLHFEHLPDLLELFNPSQQTALRLCDQIMEMKGKQPSKPLIIGVGGPDECGHSYFIDVLIEELQKSEFIIEGIDLTELLSSEFHSSGYWRSTEIEQCMMNQVLVPFSEGERVFIEEAPPLIADYQTNLFPFFLTPEMILVVWGNSLFLPNMQKIFDLNILLELSPRVATARLFGIDEREDFDPDFIKQYEKLDGLLYKEYLEKFNVESNLNHRVNFDNFHAFRLK